MNVAFYVAAAVAVTSTAMVITRLNAVHALLYLIVSLLSVALVFFTLGAPFVAALEVIIYAGAIMVLFVFVMMMMNLGPQAIGQERQWSSPKAWGGPGILVARKTSSRRHSPIKVSWPVAGSRSNATTATSVSPVA